MKMQAGVALEDKPPLGCAHSHARVPAALLQNQLPTNTPRKAADDSEPLTPMWENHDGPPGSWLRLRPGPTLTLGIIWEVKK